MALLTSIFSKLLGDSSKIIDEVVTSQEEKLILKNELEKIINANRSIIEQEVTKRWEADMQSDSWLSKNIRPMVLAFLVFSTVLMIFIDSGTIVFLVEDKWVDLLQIVLITVIGAYFGSRGLEKIKNGKQ
jgi:hypothetical protein|tara:strand:+ start:2410 stop:2799 length:390 start_codon:yes stop_codon:yes gene_type:complete